MKRIFISLSLLLIVLSCSDDKDQIQADFLSHVDTFNQLKMLVEGSYLNSGDFESQVRIVLNDCDINSRLTKKEICADGDILSKMRLLNLQKILIESADCNTTTWKFDRIYFVSEKRWLRPSTTYLYEFCGTHISYNSKTYYQKSISSNWSFIIDSNFP